MTIMTTLTTMSMMSTMMMDLTLPQSSVWAREEQKKEKRNKEKGDDPYYFGLSAR